MLRWNNDHWMIKRLIIGPTGSMIQGTYSIWVSTWSSRWLPELPVRDPLRDPRCLSNLWPKRKIVTQNISNNITIIIFIIIVSIAFWKRWFALEITSNLAVLCIYLNWLISLTPTIHTNGPKEKKGKMMQAIFGLARKLNDHWWACCEAKIVLKMTESDAHIAWAILYINIVPPFCLSEWTLYIHTHTYIQQVKRTHWYGLYYRVICIKRTTNLLVAYVLVGHERTNLHKSAKYIVDEPISVWVSIDFNIILMLHLLLFP